MADLALRLSVRKPKIRKYQKFENVLKILKVVEFLQIK